MHCKHAHCIADLSGASSDHKAWVKHACCPEYLLETWERFLTGLSFPHAPPREDCRRDLTVLAPSQAGQLQRRQIGREKLIGRDKKARKPTQAWKDQMAELERRDQAATLHRNGIRGEDGDAQDMDVH